MKKEARLLLEKAVNSLILSVEHFNRPWDCGRTEAVLILLDHSFEMLLKAAIVERGGRIRERRAKQTIGFSKCLNKALTEDGVKFLTDEQVLTLQMTNSLRDAAQHHLLDIAEQMLYIQAQAGVTLFRDIYAEVFGLQLSAELPERVLPISTTPPMDIAALFDQEIAAVRQLLLPRTRRRTEAAAKLRALAIVDSAIGGEQVQPGAQELGRLASRLKTGDVTWQELFPGVASINLTAQGEGPSVALRFTKGEGVAIHTVPEGTPGATVVGIKRVNELDFYNLGPDELARHVALTGPKTTAMIWHLKLKEQTDCFRRIRIGKSQFDRYSQKAIDRIKDALQTVDIDDVWRRYRARS
jgi:hypothetical protein